MRRVSRRPCEDGPLLEEQETEGQRQLHSLLLQQLHTDVDIQRCVAKRKCFAPASLYRPFGAQAAGVRSLSQFQALQDGEQELASLRELGLTDPEVQLWQSRDAPEAADKRGVCAAPGAKQQRLQVIRDKIQARARLLSRPQRFASSRPLSRREMEIEQSLFQGNDRLGFLTALYHRGAEGRTSADEDTQNGQQGAPSSDPMDSLYRDVLTTDTQRAAAAPPHRAESETGSSHQGELHGDASGQPELLPHTSEEPAAPAQIDISQPIGSLRGAAASGRPLAVRGDIQTIPEEEILQNRASDEEIRSIPRFKNYQPGNPSKVLYVKNLSAQASAAQLVALFSRFEPEGGPPLLYRLLTGRMRGGAFVTLPDAETAQKALQLLQGYRLLGKPLLLEFGRERREEEQR